ncbi:MAG: TIGR03621 family F420-dependent LLM class oxidoreductase [Acidimicrobiia bacterium]
MTAARRSFRFGLQLSPTDQVGFVDAAVRAEVAGFDVVHTCDHLGASVVPPLVPLAAIAVATDRIRLCPLVVNNDFHHPVGLARDVVAIDHLSGGRMELGIGAGHAAAEYEAAAIRFDAPAIRKERLAEAIELLRQLLDGAVVDHRGEHYELRGATVGASLQAHLPILVGVNGRAALAHAVRHADTIGLTMLGRTLADGQRHETRWEVDRLDATVDFIRGEARAAGRDPELHALVQAVVVTDDRAAAATTLVAQHFTPTVGDALATPFLAIGSTDQIAQHLHECRDRWGISYFSVRDADAFAPVLALVRD